MTSIDLRIRLLRSASLAAAVVALLGRPALPEVPGIVINHLPASSGIYVGSPSLAVLPNGDYVASHDEFGPNSTEYIRGVTRIFVSQDKGQTWKSRAKIDGAYWSNLFVHGGKLYLFGVDRHGGNIVIRRSDDLGSTWTTPSDSTSGLLRDDGQYHCAPMPVLEHRGRLWRAFERRISTARGLTHGAGMLSIAVGADLLQATNWTSSNFLPSDSAWNGGDMGGWIEGNAVATPEGNIVNTLRVQTRSLPERAAIVSISPDGQVAKFDPGSGFVEFPGGAKKFTIRFDTRSGKYWSLASIVQDQHRSLNLSKVRNTLALTCSTNLKQWTIRSVILSHPDVVNHGFQYVDWLFEGDDLIAACRTAYEDGQGGANNNHDANYLTFHRIRQFRDLLMMPPAERP